MESRLTMVAIAGLVLAGFLAACFVHDLWKGKTITFPLATIERADNPVGFWLAESFTVFLAAFSTYHGVARFLGQ